MFQLREPLEIDGSLDAGLPLRHEDPQDEQRMFLMPSLFEPCGLNQMYSLRYGTVPIVRRVGGLADTVQDYWPGRFDATGFVFNEYSEWALLDTIRRALWVYGFNRDAWRALQVNGMGQDLSWDRSAREYVKIYGDAISRGRA